MTWHQIEHTIGQLWPEANFTRDLMDLWSDQFRNTNEAWLRTALSRVRAKYTSKTPEIKWVSAALHEVKSEHRSVGRGDADEAKRIAEAKMRREADESRATILRELSALPGMEASMLRDEAMEANAMLKSIGEADERNASMDPAQWAPFFRGMIWAYMQDQLHGPLVLGD